MEPTPHTTKGFKRGILFTTSSATLVRLLLSASPTPRYSFQERRNIHLQALRVTFFS